MLSGKKNMWSSIHSEQICPKTINGRQLFTHDASNPLFKKPSWNQQNVFAHSGYGEWRCAVQCRAQLQWLLINSKQLWQDLWPQWKGKWAKRWPRGPMWEQNHQLLTLSPLPPGEPWGPGKPLSPFSPCSPGGPIRPIKPGWPCRAKTIVHTQRTIKDNSNVSSRARTLKLLLACVTKAKL